MQGRITEGHLPDAEICYPGITRLYQSLSRKPGTFLDLVWLYEGQLQGRTSSGRRRR